MSIFLFSGKEMERRLLMRNAARHKRVVIYSRSIISSPKTKNDRARPIRNRER